MKIAILGASGSIGSMLTRYLLDCSSHQLVLFSHHAKQLHFSDSDEARLKHVDGDILNYGDIDAAVAECDQVIYLIHLMGNGMVGRDFAAAEENAANNLVRALKANNISKVIYIGGAGSEDDVPTAHLKSRHTTGEVLRANIPTVIEYRTPMVIGENAAGYEVIRNFVNHLPIIPVPTWGNATTQPITVHDVVRYIEAAISVDGIKHEVIEIGGPEVLSYSQIFKRYAVYKKRHCYIFVIPFMPQSLVRFVFRLFKKNSAMVTAADMIESSQHSYQVRKKIPTFVSHINSEPIEKGFY